MAQCAYLRNADGSFTDSFCFRLEFVLSRKSLGVFSVTAMRSRSPKHLALKVGRAVQSTNAKGCRFTHQSTH